MLSFKPTFSLSSFTFIKRLFSSSSLSAIMVVSSGYLRLLIFSPAILRKGNAKECSNYHTIALVSHASKVMLKILQARLQQYMNRELPDVQTGFRKVRGTRDQIANIRWIMEKAESSRKTSISASLTTLKSFTVWITTSCGKFLKRWEYHTT